VWIEYKLCLLVHKTFVGHTPDYISDLLTPVADIPTNTLVAARLQQRQPLSSTDGAAIRRPCVLCRCIPCVESVADRTETHAVVNSNIQASSKDIPVPLSTLHPLTIKCAIGVIVGGNTNAAVTVTVTTRNCVQHSYTLHIYIHTTKCSGYKLCITITTYSNVSSCNTEDRKMWNSPTSDTNFVNFSPVTPEILWLICMVAECP